MKNLQSFIILLSILFIGAMSANAATWTVTKSTNSSDNVCDADCSLREAVFIADSGDTVVFNSNLVGQTFTLGGSEIVITKRIIIDGFLNNPNVVFLSGEMTSRIFFVAEGGGLDLRNMTLVQGNGVSAFASGEGGAIFATFNTSVKIDRVAFRGNRAEDSGAILFSGGRITNSSFTGNSATNCTAIRSGATTNYLLNVTVSGNFDYDGGTGSGAICNSFNGGNLFIRNSTIVLNSAGSGGGISNRDDGTLNIANSIVAQNTAALGPDIDNPNSTITSVGGNLIGDLGNIPANTFNQPNDIFGVNPLLAPLNSNLDGFPVLSHPLQAGSPARNGGINANAVDPQTNQPLMFDARGAGFPRIADTTVDKGAFEDQSGNTSLVVTKKTNSNDLTCDIDCSLREAVHQASLNFGTDTITFAPNVFGTMTLGGTEISIVNQSVNIVGYPNLNANILIVSGSNTNRIFNLNNATLNISGMTLTDGEAGVPNNLGGAIFGNNSNLTLDRMILTGNNADGYGAFYMTGGSTQRVINSTISGNTANFCSGIGSKDTTLHLANTTVSGNNGGGGGSIFIENTALKIRNSTIAFNRATSGFTAGIFFHNNSTLNIGNSIVANNIAAPSPDIHISSGSITSVGGNLIGSTNGFPIGTFSQTNDVTGVNPLLAALADNGGNVTTHLLMPNSPAINTGINANAVDPFDDTILTTDARGGGFQRIVNTFVDKGAFESLVTTASAATIGGKVSDNNRGIGKARVYVTDPHGATRTAITNSFGHFTLDNVPAGETYIINVFSKNYTFMTQIITVNENVNDLNFSPEVSGLSEISK